MESSRYREDIRAGRADCTCSLEVRGFIWTGTELRYAPDYEFSRHLKTCPWIIAVHAIYDEERKRE